MGGAVDIWRIDLANAVIGLFPDSLCDEENTRSKHLRGEKNRIRWICSRVALRTIVATLVGRDPQALPRSFAARRASRST